MRLIKPTLFYMGSLVIFILILLLIYLGSLSKSLIFFSNYYIYFNIIFASIYFYINSNDKIVSLFILTIMSFALTLVISDVILPKLLKKRVVLNNEEFSESKVVNKPVELENNIVNIHLLNNLEKAEYYFNIFDYTTAWIYADIYIDSGLDHLDMALKIKNESKDRLKDVNPSENSEKYIDSLLYKKMISQGNYIDSYYFCLDNIDKKIFDYDFYIKYKNSYLELLKTMFSIDSVTSALTLSGYSDIRFYYIKGDSVSYSIEKLVEYKGEYYISNLDVGGKHYPYVYINRDGKIFSSGFKENVHFILERDIPFIPIEPSDLRLFSKELYSLSISSLYYNFKIFSYEHIKYYKTDILINLLFKRMVGHSSLLILFFMGYLFSHGKYFLNNTFEFAVIFLSINWFIKKIGILLLNVGMSLSIIFIILFFATMVLFLIKKIKLLHALS